MENKVVIYLFLALNPFFLNAQIILIKEGITINNTEAGNWSGDNIPRSQPTSLIYRNNSITSANGLGYILQAGDESVNRTNNNLDGELISGNKITWVGSDMTSITHGIFTGYNINALIKYNYLDHVPMAIIRKSNGMTDTSGGIAYNLVKSPNVGINIKGMNGIKIYNNTFYSDRTTSQTWRGLIQIYSNNNPVAASTGTKIRNNVFYTVNKIYNIYIEDVACIVDFESDYNVFYCEGGTPVFNYLGTSKTFVQWQELGYDLHSVVLNPNFTNFSDFVPVARLDFGTDLGTEWQTGLSTSATWVVGTSPKTSNQNGKWQVGARIYELVSVIGINVIGTNNKTDITNDNETLQMQAEILPLNATLKSVSWEIINQTGKASINNTGLLTAEKNGTVKVIATANDGSGIKGELTITISNQIIPVESISVSSDGGNFISNNNGTLQLSASIQPNDATNKSVSLSVIDITGKASINAFGVLIAEKNGTVKVIGTASDGSGITGELMINISNQFIPVESILVRASGGTVISTDNGTLQLQASILPVDATNQSFNWSVINVTGTASISATGLVTAKKEGTVKAIATAGDGSGISGELIITISDQIIPVERIILSSPTDTSITTDNGTLQLQASVLPADATNHSLNWTVINVSGKASISTTGLVTAEKDGTIKVIASAADGSGISEGLTITISNQIVHVESILVSSADGNSITTDNGTLQLYASIQPANATNPNIEWHVDNLTGKASINSMGLLTADKNGTIKVGATATDGSGISGEILVTISNQLVLVEYLQIIDSLKNDTIMGLGTKINLKVSIIPSDATNANVDWMVENITGKARIDENGLLVTSAPGKIKVLAKAKDNSESFSQKEYEIILFVGLPDEIKQSGVKIFPNPTSGKIQIQIDQVPAAGASVEIRNANGQMLMKKIVFKNLSEWNLNKFESSLYLITITTNKNVFTQKIINGLMSK